MKKGCLKLILLIPVLVGIIIYIADNYGDDFWSENKSAAEKFVHKSIEKKFKEFIPNIYSDSLKTEVIDYFNKMKREKVKDISKKISEFYKSLKKTVKDSIISEIEFKKLIKILDSDAISKKIGN